HSSVVNRIEWMQSIYLLNSEDIVLQKTPYVFDVSVWELLWANWYGAKIVLAKPEGHKDSAYLHQLIEKNKITTLHFVPSMLENYNHYLLGQRINFNTSLRQIFCSGEVLNEHVVTQTYQNSINPSLKLHNLYGPTEASIDVTYFETNTNKKVYIGKPIHNTSIYVLDPNQLPVPIGVTGELHIAGAGLARGYLNNEQLTRERLVKNPFATDGDIEKGYTRMYKTGDLVRYLPDGNIEFIGRNDDQVKIRGHRIELGEIEYTLRKHEQIDSALVFARETEYREKELVAYTISKESLNKSDLRTYLSQQLPSYMIPQYFVELQEWPLTPNGKVDKKSLLMPADKDLLNEVKYVAPRNDTEAKLVKIWEEVFKRDKIGVKDDFFELGGHSLTAIRVIYKIKHELKIQISIKTLYQFTNIDLLAKSIEINQYNDNLEFNEYDSLKL
ncbi:non-ribosomal peptide synthetase, partial [Sinomicrobium oceani]|uniref:non-ribosomal peptide synthetase n=1 Tax=Sinomicrobium oceani TaxID=1150368 RepID=UPI00227D1C55